jgi:hypothetical protein
MKHIFLVDFENVHIGGLKGIKSLTKDDEIVIFFSENGNDTIEIIKELRDDIPYAQIVKNSQNALDFQLSSYLGYIIHRAKCEGFLDNTQFVIVSKDNGFDCVAKFWNDSPFVKHLKIYPNIIRAENIQGALTADKATIEDIIGTSATLNDFHSAVVKKYGMPLGGTIYNDNKAKVKELHKS